MKNVWNENVKGTLLLYFGLYTIATITNSILYLAQGIFEDPAGNWHELDRAILVMIVTVAYALIKYIKVKNDASRIRLCVLERPDCRTCKIRIQRHLHLLHYGICSSNGHRTDRGQNQREQKSDCIKSSYKEQ